MQSLASYKKQFSQPLSQRTVVFLLRENQILLGFKKRGFGMGNIVGIGGKINEGETIKQCAAREVKEEVDVELLKYQHVATLRFYFPHEQSWNQEGHAFIATSWNGVPKEFDEIQPLWFERKEIPYEKMWHDAHYWLPLVLEGKKLEGEFLFNEKLTVTDYHLETD